MVIRLTLDIFFRFSINRCSKTNGSVANPRQSEHPCTCNTGRCWGCRGDPNHCHILPSQRQCYRRKMSCTSWCNSPAKICSPGCSSLLCLIASRSLQKTVCQSPHCHRLFLVATTGLRAPRQKELGCTRCHWIHSTESGRRFCTQLCMASTFPSVDLETLYLGRRIHRKRNTHFLDSKRLQ